MDFCGAGDVFGGLFEATRGVARGDVRLDLREAVRTVGVGEGTATGWPGLVTSDVLAAGAGSRSPKTERTGAVMTRPIPQPIRLIAINPIAQLQLHFIAFFIRRLSLRATNRQPTGRCFDQLSSTNTSGDKRPAR